MRSSWDIRAEYYDLESKFRRLCRSEAYEKAQEILQQMINVIDSNRGSFDEAEDRIRGLQARKLMVAYTAERLREGENLPQLLREAANWSMPSTCLDKSCPEFEPQICAHRAMLSPRQERMCVERFRRISGALKIEAAIAVPRFDYQQVLENRRNAAKVGKAIAELTLSRGDLENQHYLEYWHFVTACYFFLLEGEFRLSKEWLAKALNAGKLLPFKRCFPNYFCNIPEIQAYKTFIDAVEKVKSTQFGDAHTLFQEWLNLNIERTGKKDLRFDNIQVLEMVCDILERLPKGWVNRGDWDKLDQFMEEAYIAKTTWALRSKLDWIREVSFKWKRGDLPVSFNLITEIANVAQDWQLFIPDAVLLGEDRTAGLRRKAILPSFVDIFDELEESKHNWQPLLSQNLKNCLLLMADYEHMRYCNPPPEERHLPREGWFPKPSEKLNIPKLAEVILTYFRRRSADKLRIFENAFNKYYPELVSAIESKQFTQAVTTEKRLLEEMRIKPHVIRVEEQREFPKPVFLDEDNPNFLARETTCFRLWNQRPDRITFEGPQNLEIGTYYYLRPRWNIRRYDRYRIRHMDLLQSDVPRWIDVFFGNIFGRGNTEAQRFHDWILQFDDSERLLACQCFDMLKFYGVEDVREMWLRIYREKLPPEAKVKGVVYFSLGHTAKSGSLNNYYFRQAMSKGLRSNEYSFQFKEAFREISEFDKEAEKPRTVIFVDDFMGTGEQATRIISRYFDRHGWLNQAIVYYCALVAFKDGIEAFKKHLPEKIKDVFVAEELDEKDKAFSDKNPVWKSEQAREEAKQWAEEIGRQVITGMRGYDPERDKLGWGDCQVLVTFHYNIPNNTLPIFWGTGKRNGKSWTPLQERYD